MACSRHDKSPVFLKRAFQKRCVEGRRGFGIFPRRVGSGTWYSQIWERPLFAVHACRRKFVAFIYSPSVSCGIWFYLIEVGFRTPGSQIKREHGVPPLLQRGKPAPHKACTRSSQQCARSSRTRSSSQPPPVATKLPQQLPQLTQLTSMTRACNGHQSWKAR